MDSMRKQKRTTPEDEPTQSESVQHAPGQKLWRTITYSSRKNEAAGQSGNDAQLWMCLMVKEKSDAVKNNIT